MKSSKYKVVICPPCGEQSLAPEGFNPGVAVATKEGQNRKRALWPLLPRVAVLPPQGREMFHGFTLIELLVVVLIIGILAAVALPQYQKAVVKSRFADALPNLHAVAQASQACYLEKGRWCEFAELSLNLGVSPTIYPHIAINSKYVSDTKYFQYAPMLHSINTGEETYSWAIAQYKTEDVCLCYTQTGNIVVGYSNSCGTKEPSYNYADLLHLTYDEECACC